MSTGEQPQPPLPSEPTRVAVDSVLVIGGIVLAGLSLIGVLALAKLSGDAPEPDDPSRAETSDTGSMPESERIPDVPSPGWSGPEPTRE